MTKISLFKGLVSSNWISRTAKVSGLLIALAGGVVTSAQAQDVDWLVQVGDTGFDPVVANADIEYTVQVDNNGNDPAPSTTVAIDIPANVEVLSASGVINGCTNVPSTGPATVTCNVPALGPLASADMVLVVRSDISGSIDVLATVPNSSQGVTDNLITNNSEPETTTVNAGADLALTVIVDPTTVPSGGSVDLDFVVTNNGPSTANGVTFSFPVPTGLTNITAPAGCTLSGGIYTCVITDPILDNGTYPITFTGQVSAAGGSTITPIASIVDIDPSDAISDNNTVDVEITVTGGSDVSITKNRSPSGTLLVGDQATFTLAAEYTGDSPTGLTISDNIPVNYQIDTITAPGWTCAVSGQDLTCTRPSGSVAGEGVSLGSVVIETTVVSAGSPLNEAFITSDGPEDSNLGNNMDTDGSATIEEPFIDLRANKSGPNPALAVVDPALTYDYRVSTTNLGNAPFVGTAIMTDSVPLGMTIDAVNLNGWTCTPAALPVSGATDIVCERTYTIGAPLAVNATTPGVVFTASFTPSAIPVGQTSGFPDNVLVVSTLDPIDEPDTGNNTANYVTEVRLPVYSPDISASKTTTVPVIPAGDQREFVLEIINLDAATGENILVVDNFTNLINNSVNATTGGYISEAVVAGVATGISCSTASTGSQSRRLSCTIDTLPTCVAGSTCPTITVLVRPGQEEGSYSNTFTAIPQATVDQDTPDPDLSNNSSTVSYDVEARADVTVTKTATPDPVAVGQQLTYVITAQNLANGLSSAENVTITDTLPDDLTFVSASPSAGTCSAVPAAGSITSGTNNQIVCNLGTISNGSQQTVTVVVLPNLATLPAPSIITNDVVVVTSTIEIDYDNNDATVDVGIVAPDLDILVNKTDSVDPVAVGDNTVYTITINNIGPSASENVVMTDVMPAANLSYQSHTVSGAGVCGTVPAVSSFGQTLECTWPYLPAGASEIVQITARGEVKGSSQNVVEVSSDEIVLGFDRLEGNNATSELTTVRSKTDLELVSKTPEFTDVYQNQNFDFVAIVRVNTGTGLAEADDVVFTDELPDGMILTGPPTAVVTTGTASSTVCTGIAGDSDFTCDLGTVSSGGVVTITIPVEIVEVQSNPDQFTNTATVETTSFDTDLDNQEEDGVVNSTSSSLSGTVFRDFADDTDITAGDDTFVENITITLVGETFDGEPIDLTTTTDASGYYIFPYFPSGTYTVTRGPVSEAYLTDGTNTEGSSGGTVASPTVINEIFVDHDTDAVEYLFPLIPQARVGIAKQVSGAVVTNDDGSFNTTFEMVVENFSLEALINVNVSDQLSGASPLFGTYQSVGAPATDPLAVGSYTILAAPTGSCGGLQSGFDGSTNTTLATGFTIASEDSCTISVSLRVQPTAPLPAVLASGGRYENQAIVTAEGERSGQTSPSNPELTDVSTDGDDPDPSGDDSATDTGEGDPTPVDPSISPSITLIKTAIETGLQSPPEDGDVISYTFEIENTGNVTLTNVTLEDLLPGIVILGDPILSLAPGEINDDNFTATYEIGLTDLDLGSVTNTATVTGTDPYTGEVEDVSGTTNADDEPTVVTLNPGPSITLIKTADNSDVQSPAQVGDVISYAFEIENTGNVTLTNVTLEDLLPGIVILGDPITSLAPDEINDDNFTATYALTLDDINAGVVTNTATATGTPPTGDDVSDDSGTTNTDDIPTEVTLDQGPAITLVKTADESALSVPPVAGDIISYTFRIENVGNVSLTDVTIVDALAGVVLDGSPIPNMDPTDIDTLTYTATYAITQADIDLGNVVNTATVSGLPPTGPVVTDETSATTLLMTTDVPSGLRMVKTTPRELVEHGSLVPYTITISNDNPVVVGLVDVIDTLPMGLIYQPGTATLDGAVFSVDVDGANITWPDITIAPLGDTVLTLQARVLNGVGSGSFVNRVNLVEASTGRELLVEATATVRILPIAVFDCSTVVGRVFSDPNGDGYYENARPTELVTDNVYYGDKGKVQSFPEDVGEVGIPGVRLVTVDGLVISTDEFGRFSIPCASLPNTSGSNFILKLDTRTLPAGYSVTTENPRVVRLTPGMMSEVNFGASLRRVARVDINHAAFDGAGSATPALNVGVAQLAQSLVENPATVVIAYHVDARASAGEVTEARRRMDEIEKLLRRSWRDVGSGPIEIQTNIVRTGQ